jgi:hypothetical protein
MAGSNRRPSAYLTIAAVPPKRSMADSAALVGYRGRLRSPRQSLPKGAAIGRRDRPVESDEKLPDI